MQQHKYTVWIRTSAFISIAIAILVMLGWMLNIDELKSFLAPTTMKFNAAVCFLLLGISIWLCTSEQKGYHRLSNILSLMVLVIAGTTLAQDVFHFKAGIDEFLIEDSAAYNVRRLYPGRMAPTTAFCLVLISFSLIMQKVRSSFLLAAQCALHLVTLISFIALVGYLFDVPAFYKLAFLASMAVHTAFTFFLLSVSLTLFNPNIGLISIFTGTGIGNIMAKRLIPLITIILLCLSYLRLEAHRLTLVNVEFGIALFGLSFLVVSILMIANTVGHLNKIDSKRHDAEDSLRHLNKTLEQKVEERTKDLKESEGKFYKIFQMSPVGLMMSEMNTGKSLDVNQSFVDLTGYNIEEAQGKTTVELGLIDQSEREKIGRLLKAQGSLKNMETYFVRKTGERRNCLMSVEVIELGKKDVALVVLADITEQKTAERKLQEAKQLAEESSIAKERFMANMSHEIRTPMNAIIGFTNLIDKSSLNSEQGQYLEFIKTSGENLLVLINDILDYSKIEAGMMQLETVPFKIPDMLHSLGIMFSEKAREKKLELITKIDDKVPAIVLGDPTRLTQILINLIGNALKFTKEGSITVDINLDGSKDGKARVSFSVKDTGIGIPEDKQKEVFERFMQASSETTRNYGGTGLGLSIVKRLVELQDGELSIKSVDGEGTEFIVVLPYVPGEDKAAENGVSPAGVVEIKKFERELKVLLAEDNVMNQILAKKVLSRFGCDVDIAENGGIALEMARIKSYDLILMDIQMPIMDGYTASQRIRELNQTVPIIAMTAHIMAGEREKCIGFGMSDYISKPFKVEDLYSLILRYTTSG